MTDSTIERSHGQAVALHQAGKVADAAGMYEALLEARPDDAELWGLLGLAQFQLGREDRAIAAWRKSAAEEAPAQVRLRTLANILNALKAKGTPRLAALFAGLAVPGWPRGAAADPGDRHMIITLARGLVALKRPAEAVPLLDSILPGLLGDVGFVKAATAILLDAGAPERVVRILQPLTAAEGPVDGGLFVAQAAAAHALGETAEAERLTRRAVEAMPVYVTRKEPGQILLVGVLNQAPIAITRAIGPAQLHFARNTPATLALRHNDQYRFLSILPEARSAAQAVRGLPRPQLILNNWVNGELLSTPKTLDFIAGFADRLGLPVVNHPRKAALTTRQSNAERLAGIAGLVIPRLLRFSHDPATAALSVRLVAEKIGFPVIIRGPFAQKGVGAEKIESRDALAAHLATLPTMQLYAIQYVDNPAAPGVYRKIRAAVIGSDVFITHVHFGPRWNVHRERDREKIADFDPDGGIAERAARMIARPQEALGRPAMAALNEIRARTSLDLYGIDFDILPDGQVLFFEANAAMNLSLSDRPGLEETRGLMRAAVRRLFETAAKSGAAA